SKTKRRRKKILKVISNRNTPLSSSNKATWNMVGLTFFAILLFSIVLVPTLIVMIPKSDTYTEGNVMEVKENEEEIEVSQLNVFVKRSESGDVEEIPLEKYVASVVASEMPAEFEIEALKAQAIAA